MYILGEYIAPLENEIDINILRTGTMVELVSGGVFQIYEVPAGEVLIVLGRNKNRETLVARIDPDGNTISETMPCFLSIPEGTKVRILPLAETEFERI